MRRPLSALVLLAVLGPALPAATVTQFSTIDALIQGLYEAPFTFAQVKQEGDFGLGTLDGLDGEMIGLDGAFYKITPDGRALPVPDAARTPFATVAFFHPDRTLPLKDVPSFAALQQLLDRQLPSPNFFYAFRITGLFTRITARSVVRQTPPYRPLPEVVKTQALFHLENVRGTLVGFRCPAYAKGLNVVGYHLHFLSDDHLHGGHLLDFTIGEATAAIETLDTLKVVLPHEAGFEQADFSSHDEEAVRKVEKLAPK